MPPSPCEGLDQKNRGAPEAAGPDQRAILCRGASRGLGYEIEKTEPISAERGRADSSTTSLVVVMRAGRYELSIEHLVNGGRQEDVEFSTGRRTQASKVVQASVEDTDATLPFHRR